MPGESSRRAASRKFDAVDGSSLFAHTNLFAFCQSGILNADTNLIIPRFLLQQKCCSPKGASLYRFAEVNLCPTGVSLLVKTMNNIQTKKFFLYARKSTDTEERQVRSIDDQLAELRELALRENIEIVKVYTEKQTAKAPGRPVFNEMLADIEKGVADGILAWHPDRLARNSVDGGKIIWLLDIGKINSLKFSTFWFENTPQGKFMLQIAFGQSKYYVDNLSENIKRGIRQKLKNGLWPQMAPMGYLNDKNRKTIEIDPPKALLIKKSFELYASGRYSLAALRQIINAEGLLGRTGSPMSISNFQYLLKNPFYCGLIRFGGEVYEGRHEPLITKKLFDEVQAVMHHKSKPNRDKKSPKYFVFRGLIYCGECGCLVTAEMQKGHTYYRCTKRKTACSQKYLREEDLRKQVSTSFQKVSLPSDWAANMVAELEKERAETAQSTDPSAQKLRDKIAAIDVKLGRLNDGYLASVISLEDYRVDKDKLLSQKQLLKEKLTAFEQRRGSWFEPAIAFIKQAETASTLAKSDNDELVRNFLEKIGSNFRLAARRLDFSYTNDWVVLSENHERFNWRRRKDSNLRSPFEDDFLAGSRYRPLSHASNKYFASVLECRSVFNAYKK